MQKAEDDGVLSAFSAFLVCMPLQSAVMLLLYTEMFSQKGAGALICLFINE